MTLEVDPFEVGFWLTLLLCHVPNIKSKEQIKPKINITFKVKTVKRGSGGLYEGI